MIKNAIPLLPVVELWHRDEGRKSKHAPLLPLTHV